MGDRPPIQLVGGGLANCLLALRLESLGIDFTLMERGDHVAGDHTWSFHESDLHPADLRFARELITRAWPGYEVQFPDYTRAFSSAYFTIRSQSLRETVYRRIPKRKILLNHGMSPEPSDNLVDARGFSEPPLASGWQKFVGWDVRFNSAHGLDRPVIMDATVEQIDGYRFLYLLPLDECTLLIEDTRYSNSATIDQEHFHSTLTRYIESRWPNQSWTVARTEQAALPIPLNRTGVAGQFGVAGGFFHPVTGYSFPYAMRTSRDLAARILMGQSAREALMELHSQNRGTQNYYLWLNRMMFLAARPDERWRIFARFYRLHSDLIERFYAGQSTVADKLRLLIGRPPVPIGRALRALAVRSEVPAWS